MKGLPVSRVRDRANLPVDERVRWVEGDLDGHDREIDRLELDVKETISAFRTENEKQHSEVKGKVEGLQRVMYTVLVTLIGVLGALVGNLIVK
jgi:hypothetical protein